jgi:hypothetical protein
MLRQSGELDRILDGRGLTFERAVQVGPPTQPAQPFIIPPPPWSPNYRPELEPDYEPPELVEDTEASA